VGVLDRFQQRRGLFKAVRWGKAVVGGCELAMKLAITLVAESQVEIAPLAALIQLITLRCGFVLKD
jgi:hypothetical protein